MKITAELGKRLKTLRKELGLTQDQLAAKVGIHGRQLARYELGSVQPSLHILDKIANFCEVTLDFLAHGQDRKLAKKTSIEDAEILDLLRRIDHLKKPERERLKWAIKGLLNGNDQPAS